MSSTMGSGRRTRREFLSTGMKTAAATAFAAAGAPALAACGGSSSGSSGPLTFWNFYGPASGPGIVPAQSQWFVNTVNDWNKTQKTKVQLRYVPVVDYVNGSKLQTAFAAGNGPDIFLLSPGDFLRYYNGGVLQDLTPYMTAQARNDFFPSVMATRTVGGKIYGLPMEVEPMAIYYSQKAWEAAHLSEGDIPQTWDQLLNVAGKLKQGRQFGLAFEVAPGYYQNFTWYPWMWQGHGDAVSGGKQGAFDSPATVNALSVWQQAIKEGLAPRKLLGTGGNDVTANLVSGYTAIFNSGIWGVAMLRAAPNFPAGVFKLPLPPGGSYTTTLGGWAFVVNAKGKNPDAAAKFVTWALGSMSPDSIGRVVDWCIKAKSDISPRQSALTMAEQQGGYNSPLMQYFKNQIFPGGRGEPRYPPQVYQAISNAIQACQLGGASPSSQAAQAEAQISSYLKGYTGAQIT